MEFLGLQAWEAVSPITLREFLWGNKIISKFCNKGQVGWTSKDYCKWKKTGYFMLRNLVLFYLWEDARVWSHWNHSFDMHLSFWEPGSCFHIITFLKFRCGEWLQSDSCEMSGTLSFLNSLRAHQLTKMVAAIADDVTSFVYWCGGNIPFLSLKDHTYFL